MTHRRSFLLSCALLCKPGDPVAFTKESHGPVNLLVDYAKNLAPDGSLWSEFEHSLFVLATVMSRPTRERAVLDAGLKALSVDAGLPWVVGMPGVEYIRASGEHGKLALQDPNCTLEIGSKIRLIPGHCDPTVNLYDWFVCYRNDRVEALWPITARGAVC